MSSVSSSTPPSPSSSSSPSSPLQPRILPTYVNFSTAGLGGIMGWTIVHPFNTLSVRMNLAILQQTKPSTTTTTTTTTTAQSPPSPPTNLRLKASFAQFTYQLVRSEGISSLYAGITAGWTRQIFYSTSVFGFFEFFRDQISKYREVDYFSRMIAGIGSGAVAALVSCSAEVSLVRISNDKALPLDQRRNYQGIFDAFVRIYREEGFRSFFRGVEPFVIRAILVGAIQIGTYDHFREVYRERYQITDPMKNVFAGAMTSGLLYSFITMPLETVKNRLAFQKINDHPATGSLQRNLFQVYREIIRREGVRRLWSGYLPYYLRCGLHTLCMFSSIELLRKQYTKYAY